MTTPAGEIMHGLVTHLDNQMTSIHKSIALGHAAYILSLVEVLEEIAELPQKSIYLVPEYARLAEVTARQAREYVESIQRRNT